MKSDIPTSPKLYTSKTAQKLLTLLEPIAWGRDYTRETLLCTAWHIEKTAKRQEKVVEALRRELAESKALAARLRNHLDYYRSNAA